MYIIIMGGEQVGFNLATKLINQGNEVLIIEQNPAIIDWLEDKISDDAVLLGDGCEAVVQEQAGMIRADMFIATTDEDEDNLVACQLAKTKYNVRTTISRVHDPNHEDIFELMGVDYLISDVDAIIKQIDTQLTYNPVNSLLEIPQINSKLIKITIPENAHVIDHLLKDINIPENVTLLAVYRGELPVIKPTSETYIMANDVIIASVKTESEEAFIKVFTE